MFCKQRKRKRGSYPIYFTCPFISSKAAVRQLRSRFVSRLSFYFLLWGWGLDSPTVSYHRRWNLDSFASLLACFQIRHRCCSFTSTSSAGFYLAVDQFQIILDHVSMHNSAAQTTTRDLVDRQRLWWTWFAREHVGVLSRRRVWGGFARSQGGDVHGSSTHLGQTRVRVSWRSAGPKQFPTNTNYLPATISAPVCHIYAKG